MITSQANQALLVTSSFPPGKGGIESYLSELCDQVSPRLAVLSLPQHGQLTAMPKRPYPVFPLPQEQPWPSHANVESIIQTARKLGTNKIFFGTPWPLALCGPDLKRQGFRYIVLAHAAEFLIPISFPVIGRRLARALSEAELLFTVSNFTASKLKLSLEQHNLRTPDIFRLPPRVDTNFLKPTESSALRQSLGMTRDAKVILFLSRLVERKGAQRLIAAMPAIRQQVPQAVAVIGGTGPFEKHLRKLR